MIEPIPHSAAQPAATTPEASRGKHGLFARLLELIGRAPSPRSASSQTARSVELAGAGLPEATAGGKGFRPALVAPTGPEGHATGGQATSSGKAAGTAAAGSGTGGANTERPALAASSTGRTRGIPAFRPQAGTGERQHPLKAGEAETTHQALIPPKGHAEPTDHIPGKLHRTDRAPKAETPPETTHLPEARSVPATASDALQAQAATARAGQEQEEPRPSGPQARASGNPAEQAGLRFARIPNPPRTAEDDAVPNDEISEASRAPARNVQKTEAQPSIAPGPDATPIVGNRSASGNALDDSSHEEIAVLALEPVREPVDNRPEPATASRQQRGRARGTEHPGTPEPTQSARIGPGRASNTPAAVAQQAAPNASEATPSVAETAAHRPEPDMQVPAGTSARAMEQKSPSAFGESRPETFAASQGTPIRMARGEHPHLDAPQPAGNASQGRKDAPAPAAPNPRSEALVAQRLAPDGRPASVAASPVEPSTEEGSFVPDATAGRVPHRAALMQGASLRGEEPRLRTETARTGMPPAGSMPTAPKHAAPLPDGVRTPRETGGAVQSARVASIADTSDAAQPSPPPSGQDGIQGMAGAEPRQTVPHAFQAHLSHYRHAPGLPLHEAIQHIAHSAARGKTRLEIQLEPAHLGRIQLALTTDASRQIQVHLVADQATTRQILEQQLPQLRSALAEQGLDLAGFTMGEHRDSPRDHRRDQAEPMFAMEHTAAPAPAPEPVHIPKPATAPGRLSIRI